MIISFFFCLVKTGNFQLQVCPQNVEFTVRRRDICATVSLSTACICVSHDDLWVYLPRLVIYLFADLFFRLSSEDVTSLELWLANWAILFWHLCISVPIGPFFLRKQPIERGVVVNWDDAEYIFMYLGCLWRGLSSVWIRGWYIDWYFQIGFLKWGI